MDRDQGATAQVCYIYVFVHIVLVAFEASVDVAFVVIDVVAVLVVISVMFLADVFIAVVMWRGR